jgi:hypothetical protein
MTRDERLGAQYRAAIAAALHAQKNATNDIRQRCIESLANGLRTAPTWLKLCAFFLDGPAWWERIAARAFDALLTDLTNPPEGKL